MLGSIDSSKIGPSSFEFLQSTWLGDWSRSIFWLDCGPWCGAVASAPSSSPSHFACTLARKEEAPSSSCCPYHSSVKKVLVWRIFGEILLALASTWRYAGIHNISEHWLRVWMPNTIWWLFLDSHLTLEAWDENLAILNSGLYGSLHSQVLLSTSCDTSAREGQFFWVYSQAKPHTLKRQSGQGFQSLP